jgi:IS30 family transposase
VTLTETRERSHGNSNETPLPNTDALDWSPELIAGRLLLEHPGFSISHEAIYQYIFHPKTADREELIASLRRCHRKRMHESIGRKVRKTKIPNRVPIDVRPKSVESRHYCGHGKEIASYPGGAPLP